MCLRLSADMQKIVENPADFMIMHQFDIKILIMVLIL